MSVWPVTRQAQKCRISDRPLMLSKTAIKRFIRAGEMRAATRLPSYAQAGYRQGHQPVRQQHQSRAKTGDAQDDVTQENNAQSFHRCWHGSQAHSAR